ncbi:disulfide bond formation protein DsbA [Kribbella antibiotica]|uniref:Disulfide bond formation protein DsbA n=1 Tax=Kribbella antibiotica TaxID=190195 RepID=A0A4R4YWL8_9ACTN|nr:thioredoxin domain-containing protein [Kribbella antibiotica]TDD49858.1 disulfide bond formation protein DsbA [Kribbella antibiotica]
MSSPNASPLQQQKKRVAPGVIVVIVLVLALAAGVGFQYLRGHFKVEASGTTFTEPAVLIGPGRAGEGVTVGKDSAKVQIDLYLDFRCPHCAEFEELTGSTIDKLVADGTAKLTYWPLAFVNPDASPRLANAFAAAAANGKALTYADEMYRDFKKSWNDDQLIELAKQLGIGDAKFQQAVQGNTYGSWVTSVGKSADARGVTGTPTVFVNDKKLETKDLAPEGLQKAVDDAAKAAN